MQSSQLLLEPFLKPGAKVISVDSERLADRFQPEGSLCVAVGNPRLGLGEPSTMNGGAARGASLKAPQGIHEDRQHQLLGAVKARVVGVYTRVPLHGHQNVGRYQFGKGAL